MSWCRLSDDFWCDPVVLALSAEARDLFVRLVSYCGQRLNDGALAHAEIPVASAGQPDAERRVVLLAELEAGGFLAQTEMGYQVVRFERYLRAKADVERDREIKRQGGLARAGQASRQGGRFQQAAGGRGQQAAGGTTSIRPVPSRTSFGSSSSQQAAGRTCAACHEPIGDGETEANEFGTFHRRCPVAVGLVS